MVVKIGKKEITVVLKCGTKTVIDAADAWILKKFPVWVTTGTGSKYVCATRNIKTEYSSVTERIYLHRLIVHRDLVSCTRCEQVDHIDRDRLNNRRSNLRICSAIQNRANVAAKNGKRFKGVFDQGKYRKLSKPFRSYLDCKSRGQQRRKYLGYFKTEEEAARAYDREAKRVYGEFAFLNFPNK